MGRASSILATALRKLATRSTGIGYDKAADLSKRAYKEGKTIRETARETTDLSEEDLERLLDAKQMGAKPASSLHREVGL